MENKKLKILFISSWYPSKLKPLNGIFVKRHAAANTLDCDVSVIYICTGKTNSIEETVEDGIYTLRGYYAPYIPGIPILYGMVKLLCYMLLWRKVLSIYKKKKGKPDLVNSNIVYPVSIIATIIKFIWNVPYVITEHWTGYFPEDGRYKGIAKKIISKIAVAGASAVITNSSKLSRTMLSFGLIPKGTNGKNKYFTIPNVVNPEQFKLKPLNNTPGKGFNFIHISSLDDEQKNISGILRTFKKFHAIHPSSKLTIIWDEESKEAIERIKEPFSEEQGVLLVGKREGEALAAYLQKADAFILFSNYENLPCVMLEAFCCGVPVIGTKVGDVPEYIDDANGILIDIKDEPQLLGAMEKMAMNPAHYNPGEIRNMVLDKVNPSAISKQFTDVYKIALQHNSVFNI